jgi:uncharacterized membrane protein YeiH
VNPGTIALVQEDSELHCDPFRMAFLRLLDTILSTGMGQGDVRDGLLISQSLLYWLTVPIYIRTAHLAALLLSFTVFVGKVSHRIAR